MPTVRVPQKDGSITIRRNGLDPVERTVKDHEVTVSAGDLGHFLSLIEGSRVVEKTSASTKKES